MKKFIYLCGMMLLSLNIMAQIDLNDRNWKNVLNDDFDLSGRYWIDSSFISSDSVWKAYSNGLTHGNNKMIYQYSQCHFNDTAGYMELVAEYARDSIVAHNYHLPYTIHNYPVDTNLYYFSGRIDHYDKYGLDSAKYKYGYFEIRCKLPVHQGAFPAFWLQSSSTNSLDPYYEEIDIFEYSWSLGYPNATWLHPVNPHPTYAGDPHVITCGIYHNLTGESPSIVHPDSYGRVYPSNMPDVSADFHVYGCEWMPDYVIYYRDGKVTHEFRDVNHIPQHPKYIKTGYAIDKRALESNWLGPDTLSINYIKAYKLNTDCGTDMYVQTAQQLNQIDSMKGSITISNPSGIALPSTTDKILRASDYFIINGPFEIATGAQLTLMVHECPNYTSNYTEMSNP